MSYAVQCDALLCIYRRSAMDYRRFAEAEADLDKELAGIRDPGGADIEALAPKTRSKDIGLIACMPHAIEPILLEDNQADQATIRILESGKSPAFRHADKLSGLISVGLLSNSVVGTTRWPTSILCCKLPTSSPNLLPTLINGLRPLS